MAKRKTKTRATDRHKAPASQKGALRERQWPWRERTATIHQFPRCFAYLKAMRVRFDDPAMTDYWAASIMSDAFSDKKLAAFGSVNFDTMTGRQLLNAFEAILSVKPRASKRKLKPAATVDAIKGSASEAEIIAAMTPRGGWKAATLAKWGIAWPPPQGWRRKLVENFEAQS